jgi:hypothetical protein
MMDISTPIDRLVGNYLTQWWLAHPYLAWMAAHPVPSCGLLLLAIFSLWGLFKAIGRGIEQIWLFLLTTPFKLLQPIFKGIWSAIRPRFGHTNSNRELAAPVTSTPATARIAVVVAHLQQLSQEQDILLQELAQLADSTSVPPEIDRVSDTQYKNMYAKLLKLNPEQHL